MGRLTEKERAYLSVSPPRHGPAPSAGEKRGPREFPRSLPASPMACGAEELARAMAAFGGRGASRRHCPPRGSL